MSELCIVCNSPVKGRRHAVTCGVCDRWQHRLCGTGIYLFIYLFISRIVFVGQIIYLFILLIIMIYCRLSYFMSANSG